MFSKYRLARVIGRGGMGTVYEADGPGPGRFAIKVLHAGTVQNAASRFLREGKIASRLEHRHIVPVIEVGADETDGAPFLVMPLLEGRDLGALLAARRPLPPAIAARIAYQACEGLGFGHAMDVVHRDIKPSNLFLESKADGSVVVRICDFGLAKMIGLSAMTQLTDTGARVGTPLYMSPESMRGAADVDARSDVYAVGATLYEMLAGRAAWGDLEGGPAALALAVAAGQVPALADRAPWIEAALASLVARAMARDPKDRPAGARELAALLRPFCGDDVRLTNEMLGAFEGEALAGVARLATTARDPLLGARIDGRYRILHLLARGGMGSVYEAEAPDGTRVAVKLISGDLDRTDHRAVQRFLGEAEAVRSIEHAHVVRTLETGTDRALGSPFIVMELLRGVDLRACIRQRGALEVAPAIALYVQAASGIHAAHERGVIHRDIKPANLFLQVAEGGSITVKVCDFGLAKRAPNGPGEATLHGLTASGGMLGSPRYMSPEQAQDAKRVDRRSDVWSLCIALYETLSGRRAWGECVSLGEIIVAICTRDLTPLREVAPWVDPRIAAIVHRGIARDPDARWSNMAELAAALEEHGTAVITLDDLRPVPDTRTAVSSGAPRRRDRGFWGGLTALAAVTVSICVYCSRSDGRAWPSIPGGR